MAKMMDEYLDLAGEALNVVIGQGTSLLATRVDQYAKLGEEMAKTLRNNGETQAADYAQQLGRRAHEIASYFRDRDGRRIWSDAQDALNGRGWVVATAGVAAGFIISRAIRSSPPAGEYSSS